MSADRSELEKAQLRSKSRSEPGERWLSFGHGAVYLKFDNFDKNDDGVHRGDEGGGSCVETVVIDARTWMGDERFILRTWPERLILRT